MYIEKNRHLVLLEVLIRSGSEYISSETLARDSMSSVRTVKNDLADLDAMLRAEGCVRIESKKASGYRLMPLDETAFEKLCETVRVYRILFYDRSIESMNRRLFVLQSLLAKPYVLIDDLADALYVSRSSLAKEIAWAKEFLSSYDIRVISSPGKGMFITGSEQDIRSAMIEVFSSQYHEIETEYPVNEFNDFFHMEEYADIRHTLLKILRESEISVSDVGSKKLATYLCLIRERHDSGFVPECGFLGDDLSSSYEFSLAEKVFSDPLIARYVVNEENEIMNFARMITIHKDVNLRNETDRKHLSALIIRQSEDLLKRFRKAAGKDHYQFLASGSMDSISADLQSVLARVLLQKQYDRTYRKRLYTYTETGENHYAPLAMEAARLLVEFLEKALNTKIRGSEIRSLASIFAFGIRQIHPDYLKRRLAVFSMEGRSVSEQMKQSLMTLYPQCIEKIDVFNLYEMRRIDFSDYDAAVSSWNVAYYRYPVELVIYNGINRQKDRKQLFEQLILPGMKSALLARLTKQFSFQKDVPIRNYTELIQLVSEKYSHDPEHCGQMIQKAVRRYSTMSYYNPDSGISMIFLDHSDTGKEIFEVYQPGDTVFWAMGLEIRYFIVTCIDQGTSPSDIRLLSQMIHMMFMDAECISRMILQPEEVLKKLFVSAAETVF